MKTTVGFTVVMSPLTLQKSKSYNLINTTFLFFFLSLFIMIN